MHVKGSKEDRWYFKKGGASGEQQPKKKQSMLKNTCKNSGEDDAGKGIEPLK